MPHSDLARIQEGFFSVFLPSLPGTPTRAALESAQGGTPLVYGADYVRYDGADVRAAGASRKPRFALRVAPSGGGGAPQTWVMMYLLERIDVATDSRATIERVLADFRPPIEAPAASGAGGSGAGGSGSGGGQPQMSQALARAWAQALDNAANRTALAKALSQITSVPAGLPTPDLDQLKTFLQYFGTYKTDGAYYAKGAVTEGQFPTGASAAYAQENLLEVAVPRDSFYVYGLLPERLFGGGRPDAGRQVVYRIDDAGADASPRYSIALLHTVAAQGIGSAARFFFFFAEEGLGVPLRAGARVAVGAGAAGLVSNLPTDAAGFQSAIDNPLVPVVGTTQSPEVLLTGRVNVDGPLANLPPGVVEGGEGIIRTFRAPPAQLDALFHHPNIVDLDIASPMFIEMTDAKTFMQMASRTFPTTPAGITADTSGRGVVVGIVDSGIDGQHPAFLGRADDATKTRIHAVWQMRGTGGSTPWQRAATANKSAYAGMNHGREHIGHDEVTATDSGSPRLQDWSTRPNGTQSSGHGTHVAGIAAGRSFGTAWPGGMAPGATIVVASTGSIGGYVNDVIAGVQYCFQKAAELGAPGAPLPCVVNISLGTERHSHDGSDPLSVALTELVSQNRVPAAGLASIVGVMPSYVSRKVICAAAGNNRADDNHWQATVAPGATVRVLYRPFSPGAQHRAAEDGATFWAHTDDGSTVRLEMQARDSANPVLATSTVNGPLSTNGPVSHPLAGGLNVNVHNGPARPNNGHYNPEIYWILNSVPATPQATSPWIISFKNVGRAQVTIHGFCAYREHRGRFVFTPATTQSLLGFQYTAAELASFISHKVSTPGTAIGTIGVAALTSRAGAGETVGHIAFFSSPGPLRAVIGRRALDVAAPGHRIESAKSWMPTDASRGVVDKSGTSMATPVVSGLVAALMQMRPDTTTADVRSRLEAASTVPAGGTVNDWGLGAINGATFLRP